MSIIQKLSEGIVNRDMKQEGQALLNKWSQTGLLEGLQNERQKHSMARLLENQAKELLREATSMNAGDVEGFAAVAFPIVRRVFAGLIANDLVSVQPMSLPSGLIFFLDFTYNTGSAGGTVAAADSSIYGTEQVAKGIQEGVNLVGATHKDDMGGAYGLGAPYSSPTGSCTVTGGDSDYAMMKTVFPLSGSVTEANKKLIGFDPDLLSLSDGTGIVVLDVTKGIITGSGGTEPDFNNLAGFSAHPAHINDALNCISTPYAGTETANNKNVAQFVRRLAREVSATESATGAKAARFVIAIQSDHYNATTTAVDLDANLVLQFPMRDNLAVSDALGSIKGTASWGLEANENIPEIDIKVDSIAITAQTKKLKAKWTPELGQDLNAYHNLDAEVELTSILSEQIALEIDREILSDLINGAKASTFYWSRSPGLFVDRETGLELGATAAAPDFTGTVSEWYETLIETINDVSAQIHRKTLRGGANFVVTSPEVANILEFTSGFRANVTADADKGDIGAVKVGALSRKFDVIVDPYFPRNLLLVGRRGNSFLESGYVYAPYVPLQTTPTIFGPEDFVPRKGVMTRYGKKMVRPDMYGLVIVRGLLGESGS